MTEEMKLAREYLYSALRSAIKHNDFASVCQIVQALSVSSIAASVAAVTVGTNEDPGDRYLWIRAGEPVKVSVSGSIGTEAL
jgi:hypothetical protein